MSNDWRAGKGEALLSRPPRVVGKGGQCLPLWGQSSPFPESCPALGVGDVFIPFSSSPEDMLIDFRERGRGRGEKHRWEREASMGCLWFAPGQGMEPQPGRVPSPGIESLTFRFAG